MEVQILFCLPSNRLPLLHKAGLTVLGRSSTCAGGTACLSGALAKTNSIWHVCVGAVGQVCNNAVVVAKAPDFIVSQARVVFDHRLLLCRRAR